MSNLRTNKFGNKVILGFVDYRMIEKSALNLFYFFLFKISEYLSFLFCYYQLRKLWKNLIENLTNKT